MMVKMKEEVDLLKEEKDEMPRKKPAKSESLQIGKNMACFFEKPCREIGPQRFQSLVLHGKVHLLEVALHTQTAVCRLKYRGKLVGRMDAAIRCSHWNGFDLGKDDGARALLKIVKERRPDHVWISTECGPYSPMQAMNQRSQQQIEALARSLETVHWRKLHLHYTRAIWYPCDMGMG